LISNGFQDIVLTIFLVLFSLSAILYLHIFQEELMDFGGSKYLTVMQQDSGKYFYYSG